ncbi:DNA circularization N-terminal domain-containing protein [Ralstonia sp. SM1884_UCD616_TZ26]|uniref:DNA circularization N-terminal domain-containing protein n=1 Tax=Ralstonia pseudosolanacearum TaxID=1310165 RepID=UPI00339A1D62
MSWEDRLVGASFRGVDFLTESHEARGGRRLVVHELPGAEEPEVEDLGAKAWDWKLSAYFIGPDYDLERDAFLERLNQPGADWLTHPWLGEKWVRARDWSVHESNDKGGYCVFTIEFVPGGGTVAAGETDAVDVAYDCTEKLADAAMNDFTLESMSFDGMTAFVAAVHQRLETLRQVISLATLPLTWASQVMNLIAGAKGDLATLMTMPSAYANALRSLTNSLGGGADDTDYPATSRVRVVARIASVATAPAPLALSGVASTDGAVRRNLLREEALRGRLLVTAATEIAMADYRAEADRDAALGAVVAALDALLPNMPDPVFEAAVAARAAVIEALLAQDLKPAATRDVTNPLPAIVLAHRLGVDESVFLVRNAVRHPLFVKGRVYG